MTRKIDLVYLWVDGNDKNWRAEKEKWQAIEYGKAVIVSEGLVEARWRDNDELKYSLRSAEMFAPWINHIYIVTGFGQVPSWLDTSNSKITIINDFDILPQDAIPTFNSVAIENCLTNIPGLSECFLYANDDMFFGRPITPVYFFDNNDNPIVWYGKIKKRKSFIKMIQGSHSNYNETLCHSGRLIKNLFGEDYIHMVPSHNIEPYRKSRIKELLSNPLVDVYSQKTIHSKFRTKFDLHRWIFSLYDIAIYNSKFKVIQEYRKNPLYNLLYQGTIKNSPLYTRNALKKDVANLHPYLFCINDTEKSNDQDRLDNKEFLKSYFPNKSKFEK